MPVRPSLRPSPDRAGRGRDPRQRQGEGQPPLRVLHAAAELFPWVKTGGLGDVMAALPPALAARGIDVRLVLPGFSALLDALEPHRILRLRTPFFPERVRLALAQLPESGISLYLIDHPPFYDRPGG